MKGINNGQSGFGMYRALFPSSMGGPFGLRGQPLPYDFSVPKTVLYGKVKKSRKKSKKGKKSRKSQKTKSYL